MSKKSATARSTSDGSQSWPGCALPIVRSHPCRNSVFETRGAVWTSRVLPVGITFQNWLHSASTIHRLSATPLERYAGEPVSIKGEAHFGWVFKGELFRTSGLCRAVRKERR